MKKIAGVFILLSSMLSAQNNCQQLKQAVVASIYNSPENLRSDTFNILKYTIALTIGTSTNQQIGGYTDVRFVPKINNRTFIRLDLLKMQIDSVREGNSPRTYAYNDTLLKINFGSPKNTTDTSVLRIYYHGQPVIDQTGWGGFYFDNTQGAEYAYNLGVGFGAKPHNYGRVWFPCFDNFVERSKYEYQIKTDVARRAYCNGTLTADVVNNATRTCTWKLNEEIPTYLASVAVAQYTQVNWSVNAAQGPLPIILAAHANDTAAIKAGFVNLPAAILGFEHYYGPYKWNRVGYAMVPFSSGAMEHATNITFPKGLTSQAYEADLMAHELAHHWWGNLVTCETQEDMWINEGWATYSSFMFTEWKYGRAAYRAKMMAQHEQLLHFLHKKEGFRAISGVPHSLTYGDHVYKKGADVAHTLRGYLGDSLFFLGLKSVMLTKQYQSMNSQEFQILLQNTTGMPMSAFFNAWVFGKGWSHFAIDSVRFLSAGPSAALAIVSVQQKLYGAQAYHNNVPLRLTFFDALWHRHDTKVMMSGQAMTFTVNVPFTPVYTALNFEGEINDATTFETNVIKSVGNLVYPTGKALLLVQQPGSDSSLVRIVHHFVKPDPFKNNPGQCLLSNQRYWTVEGLLSPGFHAKIRFNYDGTKGTSGANTYLDTLLTRVNNDSIALFFRKDARDDWRWMKNVFKTKAGAKTGYIELDSVQLGEYAFANLADTVSMHLPQPTLKTGYKVYPNPASGTLHIETESVQGKTEITLINAEGKIVKRQPLTTSTVHMALQGIPAGTYLVSIANNNKQVYSKKIILQ